MTIKQNLVDPSKYGLKCPNPMTPIGICVHNTANDAPAKNEISYMIGNTSQTSFHIAVDDVEAVQGIPLDRNAWHAGDGNGDGNRKHIGIEICYSKSGGEKFTKAEQNASELIAQLLKERNWGIDRVKKHQDFSGKYCPHRTLDLGWDRFLKMIEEKMGGSMDDEYGTIVGKSTQRDEVVNSYKLQIGTAEPKELLTQVQNIEKKAYDRGLSDGKSQSEIKQPPEEIEVNGKVWVLNGLLMVDGKLQGNYKRKE